MTEQEIEQELKRKAEKMASDIKKGKNIEIHLSKDGVKILSCDKKIVR